MITAYEDENNAGLIFIRHTIKQDDYRGFNSEITPDLHTSTHEAT